MIKNYFWRIISRLMKKSLLKVLGPGLIWAGASVGVSHLVQSTRAGANFGFDLVWIVLLANLLKYPFFEFAPRYAASTGESLVHGYFRMGKGVLILFLMLTLLTMFTIQSAVTAVTVGLISNLFPNVFSTVGWTIILLSACLLILLIGRYRALDKLMKIVIVTLTLSTIISVITAFSKGFHPNPEFAVTFDWKQVGHLAFLLALAGWMPSAVDVSVWHSMWTVAKIKQTGYKPKLREALIDFNIGYIGTAVLSLGFLSLGALVMYGSGEEFAQSGVGFASQLVNLYTSSIGRWAYYFIAIAALATMFSTTLTVLDAYPRVLSPVTSLLFKKPQIQDNRKITFFWFFTLVAGTLVVIFIFTGKIRTLVDIATTLSFITAPIIGYLNYKVVMGNNVSSDAKPKLWLKTLNWIGLTALSGFALYFVVWKIINL
jgi:Mn2+/Fe2+ NRAMP family transporter